MALQALEDRDSSLQLPRPLRNKRRWLLVSLITVGTPSMQRAACALLCNHSGLL